MSMRNIAVLGAGSWGMTLAVLLKKNGCNVNVWEYFSKRAKKLSSKREFDLFKGLKIPKNIMISDDIKKVCNNTDLLIYAVPSQAMRSVAKLVYDNKINSKLILSVVKGIENNTFYRMSKLIHEVSGVPLKKIFVLSGPSHAEEVTKGMPTSVVIAGYEKKEIKKMQTIFSNDFFRVYTTEDVIGVELGGAFKNIIAIGAGICDGLNFGNNTKSALMTRGITEMIRLGVKLGAQKETFYGLSGVGDLIVTCTSRYSRNRFVGEQLGKGFKCNEILKKMKMVAEGIPTAKSVYFFVKKSKIEIPIMTEVYKILYKNKSPKRAVVDLMTRKLRQEKEEIE